MSDTVKRWWVFKEQLLDEKVHRFDSDGAIPVVRASDYDAEVAAHEMTAHELKCAEANWDNLRLACDEKERVGDAFLVRAEKAEAERDDLRNYASQCSLNADNANTALSCACDELETMRAERDELTTDLQNVTNECDTHVKRYGVMQADHDRLAGVVAAVRALIATGSYTFSREQLVRALAGGEAARGERREGERRVNDPNDFSQDGFVGLHGALFAFRAATKCLHPISRNGDRRKASATQLDKSK